MMRTSYDGMTDADVPKPVLHVVKDLDGKHVDGHNRLRVESQTLEQRMTDLERQCTTLEEALRNAAKRTTDINQLRFTPAMFAATLLICASIIGGQYASTSGIRDQIQHQATDIKLIDAKMDAVKQHYEDAAKFQDLTNATMQREMTRLGGQVTMIDTKLNNLMTRR